MKNVRILAVIVCVMVAVNFASADTFGTGSNQFTIDFVPISGSTNPTSGYGIVNNDYRMGTYEITNGQWTKFKAAYGAVTGSPSVAYEDDPYFFTGTNVPTNCASWYEAAQFVNYLNTSTGNQVAYKFTGTQGQSDYTFTPWAVTDAGYNAGNPYRNSNAFYFMPTENEWVKAAYWNGTSIQTYATKAGESLSKGSGTSGTGWNFADFSGQPWTVGSGSQELNGTYDMMGNVSEWMESPFGSGDYSSGVIRTIRGGAFANHNSSFASSNRYYDYPNQALDFVGFRVASIPEPASAFLVIAGMGLFRLCNKKQ